MHIGPADEIVVPILQVRDLLRRAHGGSFNLANVCRRLDVDETHARTLVEPLVHRGFVERVSARVSGGDPPLGQRLIELADD